VKRKRFTKEQIAYALAQESTGQTIAAAESMSARIQRIKRMACGYRIRERFRNAIRFHLGRLDLYPRPASAHTDS